jgi:hypothetical protein
MKVPKGGPEHTLSVFIGTLSLLENHERSKRQELTAARAEPAKHRL